MLNYFRRTTQIVVLTFLIIFGALLMLGSFDTPVWSHPDSVVVETTTWHDSYFWFIYFGETHTTYHYVHDAH